MQTEEGLEEATALKHQELKVVRKSYNRQLLNNLDQAMEEWLPNPGHHGNTSYLQMQIRLYFDVHNNLVRVKKEHLMMKERLEAMKKKRFMSAIKTPKKLKFGAPDTKPSAK